LFTFVGWRMELKLVMGILCQLKGPLMKVRVCPLELGLVWGYEAMSWARVLAIVFWCGRYCLLQAPRPVAGASESHAMPGGLIITSLWQRLRVCGQCQQRALQSVESGATL
jgi:hypothetical protein